MRTILPWISACASTPGNAVGFGVFGAAAGAASALAAAGAGLSAESAAFALAPSSWLRRLMPLAELRAVSPLALPAGMATWPEPQPAPRRMRDEANEDIAMRYRFFIVRRASSDAFLTV